MILYEDLKLKKKLNIYIDLIIEDNTLIKELFEIIETDDKTVKYYALKVLKKLSIEYPELLYPYFERLIRLLNNKNKFIKLDVILIIPNLLKVDMCNKWYGINTKYLSILNTDKIALFGNITSCIDTILMYHKEEEKNIVPILLNIDTHVFTSHDKVSLECNNIAIGHIIDCFKKIYINSNYKDEILEFVRNNQDCTKESIRKKARKFLKLYDRS